MEQQKKKAREIENDIIMASGATGLRSWKRMIIFGLR